MNTPRIIFITSFLPVCIAELTKFVSGTYDTLTAGKLIAAGVVMLLNAALSGYLAVRALRTEPASPPSPSP